MNSYHPEDHDDNESALRTMLHIVAGIALDLQRGYTLTEAQRDDLQRIATDKAMWSETMNILTKLGKAVQP